MWSSNQHVLYVIIADSVNDEHSAIYWHYGMRHQSQQNPEIQLCIKISR